MYNTDCSITKIQYITRIKKYQYFLGKLLKNIKTYDIMIDKSYIIKAMKKLSSSYSAIERAEVIELGADAVRVGYEISFWSCAGEVFMCSP